MRAQRWLRSAWELPTRSPLEAPTGRPLRRLGERCFHFSRKVSRIPRGFLLRTQRCMREQNDRPLKYMSIATDLLARIEKGEWSSGRQLPSTMALAKEYGVALMTVRQALGILAQRGVVEPRQGAGTFVAGERARDGAPRRTPAVLITEDDEALCAAAAAALRESGFDVDIAANGGQALLRLE